LAALLVVWRSRGQGLLAPSSGDAEGVLRPASVRRGTVVGALVAVASIRSGRGDRNQLTGRWSVAHSLMLQWGPVVVTGISNFALFTLATHYPLQWGPVVVTGISG